MYVCVCACDFSRHIRTLLWHRQREFLVCVWARHVVSFREEMSGRIYKHLCLTCATWGEGEGGASLRLGQEGAALGLVRVPERTWTPLQSPARRGIDRRCDRRL